MYAASAFCPTRKPKRLPWYEMMTSPRPNSDGGGVKAWEVTIIIIIIIIITIRL